MWSNAVGPMSCRSSLQLRTSDMISWGKCISLPKSVRSVWSSDRPTSATGILGCWHPPPVLLVGSLRSVHNIGLMVSTSGRSLHAARTAYSGKCYTCGPHTLLGVKSARVASTDGWPATVGPLNTIRGIIMILIM